MIQREVWHVEAESLDQAVRRLLEEAHRGIVSPGEFMARMLRLHGYQGDSSILLRRDGDRLVITHAWRQAHREAISNFEQHAQGVVSLIERSMYLGSAEDQAVHDLLRAHYNTDVELDYETVEHLQELSKAFDEGKVAFALSSSELFWRGPLAKDEGEVLETLQRLTFFFERMHEDMLRAIQEVQ